MILLMLHYPLFLKFFPRVPRGVPLLQTFLHVSLFHVYFCTYITIFSTNSTITYFYISWVHTTLELHHIFYHFSFTYTPLKMRSSVICFCTSIFMFCVAITELHIKGNSWFWSVVSARLCVMAGDFHPAVWSHGRLYHVTGQVSPFVLFL
jgi:hypothetical protein